MEITHVAEEDYEDVVIVTWKMTKAEYDELVAEAQKEVEDAEDKTNN
jgi:hypothetical protein